MVGRSHPRSIQVAAWLLFLRLPVKERSSRENERKRRIAKEGYRERKRDREEERHRERLRGAEREREDASERTRDS